MSVQMGSILEILACIAARLIGVGLGISGDGAHLITPGCVALGGGFLRP